jgi:hypothetical protein
VAVPALASFDTSCPTPTQTSPAQSPQVPKVSGTSDQISNDEVPIPRLHAAACPFPPQPAAHAAVSSPAGSDDEVPTLGKVIMV